MTAVVIKCFDYVRKNDQGPQRNNVFVFLLLTIVLANQLAMRRVKSSEIIGAGNIIELPLNHIFKETGGQNTTCKQKSKQKIRWRF